MSGVKLLAFALVVTLTTLFAAARGGADDSDEVPSKTERKPSQVDARTKLPEASRTREPLSLLTGMQKKPASPEANKVGSSVPLTHDVPKKGFAIEFPPPESRNPKACEWYEQKISDPDAECSFRCVPTCFLSADTQCAKHLCQNFESRKISGVFEPDGTYCMLSTGSLGHNVTLRSHGVCQNGKCVKQKCKKDKMEPMLPLPQAPCSAEPEVNPEDVKLMLPPVGGGPNSCHCYEQRRERRDGHKCVVECVLNLYIGSQQAENRRTIKSSCTDSPNNMVPYL